MDRIISNNKPLEELAAKLSSSPEKYRQLQVFLHRKREPNYSPEYEFLMVSPTAFGKVELKDIQVEGNYIRLELFDCAMQEVGSVLINTNDDKPPSTVFISWKDLRKMILQECQRTQDFDELLELEY